MNKIEEQNIAQKQGMEAEHCVIWRKLAEHCAEQPAIRRIMLKIAGSTH